MAEPSAIKQTTETAVTPAKPSHPARVTSTPRPRRRRAQPDTPEYLIPRMGKLPVSDAMHFVTAHLISGQGDAEPSVISGPLKLKPAAAAQLPATGVLLTHEQGWFARGLALGNLLHSITLAPGEVTQVAVVEWHRQESGSAQESTQQDDSTSATDQRNRSVDDVQQSTLKEVQKGSSFAASASVEAEGGFSLPLFSAGGGANTTTGYSTNYSDGTRDLSLSENQKINEATTRNAQASRSRRAAVVRETSQAEDEQLTTRVVANYNHAHALTMMYFEVVEVFDLTTKVIDAERLIYLPMEIVEIDEQLLHRFGSQLAQAAGWRRDTALADDIKRWIESLSSTQAVAAGNNHSLALKSDGTVRGWGINDYGQSNIPAGLGKVVAIAAGGNHSLALKSDGTVVTWGRNEAGEANIPAGLSRVTAIAAGYSHNLALKSDGTVVGWGDNDFGMTTIPAGLGGVIAIEAGGSHSLALKKDRTVVGWGDNRKGQTNIPTGLSGVTAIAAGGNHSLALKSDGTVVGWGYNGNGEINVPAGLSGVIAMATGWDHNLALKSDGTVVGWGRNSEGQTIQKPAAILARLNREKLLYNQVMWVSQEPGAVIESLRGLKWPSDATRALSESVDPRPVTLTGNYVGYRWHFDDSRQRNKFLKQYIDAPDESDMSHAVSVAVPTGGVFGEAVLGQAVSAEKIDLTRFWKWQDSPIPILPSQISPLTAGGKARDINTSTGQLNESAAKLDQLAALPDPAGFSAASQMMTSNIFRDMSGSDVVKELALAASQHAADGADNAAQLASQNLASFMNLMKELAQMGMQQGGMDSTTLGGMQPDPEEEEGGETSGPEGGLSELAGGGGEEGGAAGLEEVASELGPLALAAA